mmetsp:Transcript_24700/g.76384  ORF Transcript_24700/g.76384 Transcript_24700/m.76384 type:complete len:268 (-) Transcript_24700:677-1480(-)
MNAVDLVAAIAAPRATESSVLSRWPMPPDASGSASANAELTTATRDPAPVTSTYNRGTGSPTASSVTGAPSSVEGASVDSLASADLSAATAFQSSCRMLATLAAASATRLATFFAHCSSISEREMLPVKSAPSTVAASTVYWTTELTLSPSFTEFAARAKAKRRCPSLWSVSGLSLVGGFTIEFAAPSAETRAASMSSATQRSMAFEPSSGRESTATVVTVPRASCIGVRAGGGSKRKRPAWDCDAPTSTMTTYAVALPNPPRATPY